MKTNSICSEKYLSIVVADLLRVYKQVVLPKQSILRLLITYRPLGAESHLHHKNPKKTLMLYLTIKYLKFIQGSFSWET